nr:2-C-methyl-D-erythritol 4-phosphate cytidylyltransferase [Deinobacterium chartae]
MIPAAGSGERLGRGPKAAVAVGGLSLLQRAIKTLAPFVDEVIVALPAGLELDAEGARRIGGGATRQQSVLRLLEASTAEHVLIHDAARPFVPAEVIVRVKAAVLETGAASAALPCADTLVREDAGTYGETVERAGTWAVQTPQGFRRSDLLAAHHAALAAGYQATDDAGLLRRCGGQVALVMGDPRTFKVTTPGDLALAEALAARWEAR